MKIVSLLPSATEIICALGLENELVGITHECDFPPSVAGRPALTASRISHERMSSAEIDHAVRSQLDGHGSIYDLDEAQLAALAPDLIVTQELCEVCAVSYETVEKAARVGAAGARVVSLEPHTIADIFDNIRLVGELAGRVREAAALVGTLGARLENLRARAAAVRAADAPRVFMLEWLEPPFSPGHWVPEQVAAAGGIPLLGAAGQKSVTTDYEAIRAANPDVLVLIPCGYYVPDILRQLEATYFPESWRTMPAVARGEVWAMDASAYFSRPAPRVIDGAEILAKIFHPAIFGAPTAAEAVKIDPNLLKFR